ncbi:hypothetical protein [Neisseria sp. Ec49-e6-T10]|uniref:hypothetical protein n=1 Tax=Neisseria sp. Ec49-e6-T10 TaxID=3140744 RepID=UPI003EBECA13
MLKAITTTAHQNYGIFPTFPKGVPVQIKGDDQEAQDWYPCDIQGHEAYVYKYLLDEQNCLLIDYNPTELDIDANMPLDVLGVYGAWLYVQDEQQAKKGWIPAEKVTTFNVDR